MPAGPPPWTTPPSTGSATAGETYGATSGTLTFGPGIVRKVFPVPILRDPRVTGDKTVLLRLRNPMGCASLFSPDTAVLDVRNVDAAGSVQFGTSAYTVNEGGPFATIGVTRTGGAASGVTVDYETSGGTAMPGEDYASTTGTLTFGAGVKSQTFSVPILDDGRVEGNSTVQLVLSNAQGGATLGPQSRPR